MKNLIFSTIFLWACFATMAHAQCTYYTLTSGQTFVTLANGNTNLFNQLTAYNPVYYKIVFM